MLIRITPIDPIVSRDSRPFGAGQGAKMYCADGLSPSTVAGALRTLVGKIMIEKGIWDCYKPDELRNIRVSGPFVAYETVVYLNTPFDMAAKADVSNPSSACEYFRLIPEKLREREGMTSPCYNGNSDGDIRIYPLVPVSCKSTQNEHEEFKPMTLPKYCPYSRDLLEGWFMECKPSGNILMESGFSFKKDLRVHTAINADSGASSESMLFSTEALDFIKDKNEKEPFGRLSLLVDATSNDAKIQSVIDNLDCCQTLGGERRLARWKKDSSGSILKPDNKLVEKISQSKRIRMILASPAILKNGWYPSWLSIGNDGFLCGTIPNTNATVRLVSAALGRWQPVSGWDYEVGKRGPKPLRRMVPSGSVYFFEITSGKTLTKEDIRNIWLVPMEQGQESMDGFNSAVYGSWSE